jgi:hypothetical protein
VSGSVTGTRLVALWRLQDGGVPRVDCPRKTQPTGCPYPPLPVMEGGEMVSSWKERSIVRRDTRQAKVQNIRPPGRSGRNTKKWCRGKVGVEHQPACISYDEWENRTDTSRWSKDWKVLVCSGCGKALDHWFPVPAFQERRPQPEWVAAPSPASGSD